MQFLKQFFNILSGVVMLCILSFLLIAAPYAIGYKPVVVLSGSMEPTFGVGSIIYYKQASFEAIREGDPITFRMKDGVTLVTHRVIAKDTAAKSFTTQGDANNTPDSAPVSYSQVAGKATSFCIPYAGYYVTYAKQMPFIVLMAAILILSTLLDYLGPKEKASE